MKQTLLLVQEGYSAGTKYEIIEIESPHTNLFDSQGKPTSKFNASMQQIRDWRRWLTDNKTSFNKIFPTVSTKVVKDSHLKFKIIIGRRLSTQIELDKRSQIENEIDAEIISFDRLTDMAQSRRTFINESTINSTEMKQVSYEKENALVNPFFECMKDSDWRKMCRKGNAHIHTHLIDEILESRTYNSDFEKYIKSNNVSLVSKAKPKLSPFDF